MVMGIGYEEFWRLNPRILNVIVEGYKLRRKVHDEELWMLGGYVSYAVEIGIGNAFRKKNDKPHSYFEVIDKPFLKSGEVSEEQKKKQLEALMASLHVMQTNFNIKHGK